MTLEEKLKEKIIEQLEKYDRGDCDWKDLPKFLVEICQQEIAEACKKAKIEELINFLVIVSGATDILDRMQTIEVLHNRIKELSPKESE